MRKFICGILVGSICTLTLGTLATGVWDNISVLKNDINVVVNGNEVTDDNFLYNDTTYIPLRAVSSALGEKVEYDETENTAYIGERKDDMTVANNKYTPPQENVAIWAFIKEKEGIYYISPDYINELANKSNIETNFKEILENDALTELEVANKIWTMTVIDGGRYITYDTFVDEIEPLLK